MIAANVVEAAAQPREEALFLGSSCIYPRMASQPIIEPALLTGELEPTTNRTCNAEIAGLKLCENYRRQYGFDAISLMPTNLYGPGDNFDLESSHVIPALMRKAHSKTVQCAGDGRLGDRGTRREFLHVDDLADASVF